MGILKGMEILNWSGINDGASGLPLRKVVENMRKVGALIEVLSMGLEQGLDEPVSTDAEELILEAGRLVERLGDRALELLDAQAAPKAPTSLRKPRGRTARRRAA